MPPREYPWPPASATGLGPFPGTDPLAAARVVFGELPQLPHLPVLPERGAGADPAGRTAALLVDLHVDLGVSGWRLVPRPGRDEQRAKAALLADLDAFEEAGAGYEGHCKVQVLGPWSLAASVELARGEKALVDGGAVRDLGASLAEGLARHVTDVRRRLPGVRRLVVEVDEPLLGGVLRGEIPTASGWGRLRAVEEPAAESILGAVLAAAGDGVGVRPATAPVALVRRCGARFLGVDTATLPSLSGDDLGEALEAGMGLLVGVLPPAGATATVEPPVLLEPLRALWHRLGLSWDLLPRAVAVTPLEGLERLDPEAAAAALRRCVELGRLLEEAPARGGG